MVQFIFAVQINNPIHVGIYTNLKCIFTTFWSVPLFIFTYIQTNFVRMLCVLTFQFYTWLLSTYCFLNQKVYPDALFTLFGRFIYLFSQKNQFPYISDMPKWQCNFSSLIISECSRHIFNTFFVVYLIFLIIFNSFVQQVFMVM